MKKPRVLFVCVRNSARSQIAEAIVNTFHGDRLEARSAGFSPSPINPLAIAVMQEWNIDISGQGSKDVFDLFKRGELFRYVITLCDEALAEKCPTFPGITRRIHWSYEDPHTFEGTHEENLERTRKLRDAIRAQIDAWVKEGADAQP